MINKINRRKPVKIEEEQVEQKPIKIGGRPRFEDKVILDEEMEELAQQIRAGFTPEEASERIGISVEKALRMAMNPVLQQRVKNLFADKLSIWSAMRDNLYENCLRTATSLVRKGEVPWNDLRWLLERLEDSYDIQKKPTTVKQTITETKQLSEGNDQTKQGSFFEEKRMQLEQEVKQ